MTIEEKLVAGETLEGDEAREVFDEFENHCCRFWLRLALVYLKTGKIEQAKDVLEQLIAREKAP